MDFATLLPHYLPRLTPASIGADCGLSVNCNISEAFNLNSSSRCHGVGKVAADYSHKWIYKEANILKINLSAWHNSADAQQRTWQALFQSGIKVENLLIINLAKSQGHIFEQGKLEFPNFIAKRPLIVTRGMFKAFC